MNPRVWGTVRREDVRTGEVGCTRNCGRTSVPPGKIGIVGQNEMELFIELLRNKSFLVLPSLFTFVTFLQ